MEQKNRLLISITIIALVVFAMFTSFGRSLFLLNTPSVRLPSPEGTTGDSSVGSSAQTNQYLRVDITPDTVQDVVSTLSRAESYQRELLVETFWTGGSSAVPVQIWADNGLLHAVQTTPSGAVRHDLVGAGTLYYWYEGAPQYLTAPADGQSADLAQRIPTYETVLALDPDAIQSAGYDQKDGAPCIYVEAASPDGQTLERYWISAESGLLLAAEQQQNNEVVYRMSTTSPVITPCPATASFSLPDGTALLALP